MCCFGMKSLTLILSVLLLLVVGLGCTYHGWAKITPTNRGVDLGCTFGIEPEQPEEPTE